MFNLLGKILLIVGIIIIIFGYFGPVKSGDPIIGTLFILVGIVVAALAFVFGRNLPPRV
ncbi:hypothetical protein LHA31_09275 [Carnobacterium viridans]|uniref:Uncharacterized protein n=1 Tax=Carnobacterium viridans TaxID=174587 RepID=A0A1H0Z839_9LACT|nr:hypothetical protein [Carnobacterium viridans]UDE94761.1 hypothetical protein LHA31_09275 [Carnobacterium viridans]SDQ23558.1 hypothetical protein SAMN04487752_1369 [Carnobacterium viridans]